MLIAVIVIAGILVVSVLALGVWLLAPSLKIFRHLDFDPPASSEEARFYAENIKMVDGGQGGG
jgi:hypothetical protein